MISDLLGLATPTPKYSKYKLVAVWMSSSFPTRGKLISLYNHCEATDQKHPWYIKYYSSFDHFHASTPTLKNPNCGLSKPGFKSVEVWMSSSIPARGKSMSLYNQCEVTIKRQPWYTKYYNSFNHFPPSTTTPKQQNIGVSKTSFKLIVFWISSFIPTRGKS